MRKMVQEGEADALVAERVWQEVARGLMERKPSRMFEVLRECGALARVMPEIDALFDAGIATSAFQALDAAAQAQGSLEVRFAAMARSLDPLAVEALADRLRAPAACRDLALLAARHANAIADAAQLDAEALLELFSDSDAWRRPERFDDLLAAALADEPEAEPARSRLDRALRAAQAVNAGDIARAAGNPAEIRRRIDAARLEAVRRALEKQ
jgi:tRNA nucleotidyltransferase (CCA-adding enzyme)